MEGIKMKRVICIALAVLAVVSIVCSCVSTGSVSDKVSVTAVINKDAKFDSADLNLDAEDFTQAGFSLGDSVDLLFSNGAAFSDVPYYNGYYGKTGRLLSLHIRIMNMFLYQNAILTSGHRNPLKTG